MPIVRSPPKGNKKSPYSKTRAELVKMGARLYSKPNGGTFYRLPRNKTTKPETKEVAKKVTKEKPANESSESSDYSDSSSYSDSDYSDSE